MALCLAGLVRKSFYGPSSYNIGFSCLNEQVISKYDTDVFIHAWEPEMQDEIVSLYNPKSFLFESQIDFKDKYQNLNPTYNLMSVSPYQNVFSMMYGRKSSIELKTKYEVENNFKYDWVILSRFDLNSAVHIFGLKFNPDGNPNCIYFPHYNQINAGPSDPWIYSNSENINYIGSLYDHLPIYMRDDNDFINACKTGWPVSSNDRFSDELFKDPDKRSTILETIPETHILNTHLLYKWHLYRVGKWTREIIKTL